ncbi:hypothetical protein EDB85DRAFT_1889247 [Lactarius pseudohatsudake]|nr:hypothetical protein EDB85DRAFT_1889247 [Lactarius pseudohatsudake]
MITVVETVGDLMVGTAQPDITICERSERWVSAARPRKESVSAFYAVGERGTSMKGIPSSHSVLSVLFVHWALHHVGVVGAPHHVDVMGVLCYVGVVGAPCHVGVVVVWHCVGAMGVQHGIGVVGVPHHIGVIGAWHCPTPAASGLATSMPVNP